METIKEVKRKFVASGKLNRKVVRDEIALSWYKCQLNHMSTTKIKTLNETPNGSMLVLDERIPKFYDYYLVDPHLNVLEKRTSCFNTGEWLSLSEHEAGTNAAALSFKYKKKFVVEKDEHYLECFSSVYSMAMPLTDESGVYAVLMLVSEIPFAKDDGHDIFSKLSKTLLFKEEWKAVEKGLFFKSNCLFFKEETCKQLEIQVQQFFDHQSPLLLMGLPNTGKSTLGHEIFMSQEMVPFVFDCSQVPKNIQEFEIKKILEDHFAVIVERVEHATDKIQNILASAIDHRRTEKKQKLHLMLTLTSGDKASAKQILSDRLYERLNQNTVYLPTFYEFLDSEKYHVMTQILTKSGYECSKIEQKNIVDFTKNYNTDEIVKLFGKLCLNSNQLTKEDLNNYIRTHVESLSDCEKNFIKEVYRLSNKNVSMACDILKISRSTFYRKLENDSK